MKNILNKVLFKNKLKKLNPNYPLVLYEEEYKVLSKSGTYPFVKIGHHLTFVTKKKDKSTTIITENGYRDLNDDEKYLLITISDYFRIKRKIFWSDDSSPPNLEVEFLNKTVIFEYGVLTKSGIDLLVANGVAVNSRYIDMILDYLFLSINNAPVHYKHKMLGFQEINGNIIYRHHKLISNSEKIIQSEYDSNNNIKPTGTYEEWLKMVENEVHKNAKLELVLAISFSAALIGYLGKKINFLNTIFQLVGDSSSGKSTAMSLAVSVYSSPKMSEGLMKTFNATDNSIQKCMERNNSVVVGFDEGGMNNKDYANLIYTLSSGASKLRLTGDGEFKDVYTWQNICMTTSEYNLLEKSDNKSGLSVRCIEIPAPFTSSAENSNNITKCISDNYAVAVEPFVQELFRLGKDELLSRYNQCSEELFALHKKQVPFGSVLDNRIIQTLTPIYVAAGICMKMKIRISASRVRDELIKISAAICDSENSIEGKALDILRSFIEKNWNIVEYPDDSDIDGLRKYNSVARIRKYNHDWLFDIYKENFDKLMADNGLSPIVVKRRLKKLGYLLAEKGRLEKRLKFKNSLFSVPCIQIKFPY